MLDTPVHICNDISPSSAPCPGRSLQSLCNLDCHQPSNCQHSSFSPYCRLCWVTQAAVVQSDTADSSSMSVCSTIGLSIKILSAHCSQMLSQDRLKGWIQRGFTEKVLHALAFSSLHPKRAPNVPGQVWCYIIGSRYKSSSCHNNKYAHCTSSLPHFPFPPANNKKYVKESVRGPPCGMHWTGPGS